MQSFIAKIICSSCNRKVKTHCNEKRSSVNRTLWVQGMRQTGKPNFKTIYWPNDKTSKFSKKMCSHRRQYGPTLRELLSTLLNSLIGQYSHRSYRLSGLHLSLVKNKLNRPQFAWGSEVSMDGANEKSNRANRFWLKYVSARLGRFWNMNTCRQSISGVYGDCAASWMGHRHVATLG